MHSSREKNSKRKRIKLNIIFFNMICKVFFCFSRKKCLLSVNWKSNIYFFHIKISFFLCFSICEKFCPGSECYSKSGMLSHQMNTFHTEKIQYLIFIDPWNRRPDLWTKTSLLALVFLRSSVFKLSKLLILMFGCRNMHELKSLA